MIINNLSRFVGNVGGNIYGGLTASIIALPLALAFGIASGAGPIAGLYGAILLGLFAAVFGGTPTQISGPTGPMTVVMTAMTTDLLARYPEQGLTIAFTVVMLGGALQVLLGAMRLGRFIIMVPYPVISGFMTGIGLIIILLQIGPFLGFESASGVTQAVAAIPQQLPRLNVSALVLGATTLAVLFAWRGRLNRLLPAPLLVLVAGTLGLHFLAPGADIARIGEIPSAIPQLVIPDFELDILKDMLVNAVMLALLGSIDSLLTSLVADTVTNTQHDSDRELIGQGIGNVVAGLFGGLPGAGATMRTMVNIRAGGNAPLSGVVHALVLFGIAVGLGSFFEVIPIPLLAGLLLKVGIDIIDWPFLRRVHRLPRFAVFLMLTVLTLTVFVDLITAVVIGIFIKNLVTLDQLSTLQLDGVVLSNGKDRHGELPEEEESGLQRFDGKVVLLRISGPLSYGVSRALNARLNRFRQFDGAIVDLEAAAFVGLSTTMLIEDFIRTARERNAPVYLVGLSGRSKVELERLGILELLEPSHLLGTVSEAFAQLERNGGGGARNG